MNTIKINSSITRGYQPDIMNFGIHIHKIAPSSVELADYNKQVIDDLIEGLESIDIESERVKEQYFRISINREKDGDKYVDNGYRLESEYVISTYLDYEVMSALRDLLTELDMEFSITYSLEDEEDIRDTLLAEAVEKSLGKARIIASSGDMQVGDMVNVVYNDMSRRPMMMRSCTDDRCDATPQDIEVTESVEVEWELLK